MGKSFSRRNFFRLRFGDISEVLGETFAVKPESGEAVPEKARIRPPGALVGEDAFSTACDRCRLCSEACPYGVILHEGVASDKDEGLPYLDVEKNPCHWCPTMDCLNACPTGALAYGDDGEVAPIAKVSLNETTCLNSSGILCDTCSYRCPQDVRAIRIINRAPQLDLDACVGCGLCVFHCDSEPTSFTVNPLNDET
jgi:ferredoxin-type protein NapG